MARYRVLQAVAAVMTAIGLAYGRPQPGPAGGPLHPRPPRVGAVTTDGAATLFPGKIQAGTVGSYELRVTLGQEGLPAGGTLLIGFPKAWFVNPFPIPKRLQIADDTKPHFLSVTASRPGATFAVTIDTTGFSGKVERFNQTIVAKNTGAALQRGDTVTVVLARTTAPYLAGADEVRIAVDAGASGTFKPFARGAPYDIEAGPAEDFTLVAPTEAVKGRAVELQLTAFDRYWNVASRFSGDVELTGLDASRPLHLPPANRGTIRVSWTPAAERFYLPEASVRVTAAATPVIVKGNPVRVFRAET